MELLAVDMSANDMLLVRWGMVNKTPVLVTKETIKNEMYENGVYTYFATAPDAKYGNPDFLNVYHPDHGRRGVEGIEFWLDGKADSKGKYFRYEFPKKLADFEKHSIAVQIEKWIREIDKEGKNDNIA
jgi:hypothetical protein